MELIGEPAELFNFTVIGNAIWQGQLAFSLTVLCILLSWHVDARVHESARWGLLPLTCYYVHRAWWNAGLVTDTAATTGPYAQWTTDYKHILLVFLIIGAYGSWRALRVWVPEQWRPRAGRLMIGFMLAHIAFWTALDSYL